MSKPIFNNRANLPTETKEGKKIWLSRSTAVVSELVALDTSTDTFYTLIEQRGPASLGSPGLWCFPCGYLDWDETLRDAAIRETWEEAGINVLDIPNRKLTQLSSSPWHIDSDPRSHRQNISVHFGFYFEVDSVEQLPKPSAENCEEGEISDLRWVKASHVFGELDQGYKYEMAFNHDKTLVELIGQIQNLLGQY
jgi:8-oxo-dGTP pyrophosphatase MutT (NUDIX family)